MRPDLETLLWAPPAQSGRGSLLQAVGVGSSNHVQQLVGHPFGLPTRVAAVAAAESPLPRSTSVSYLYSAVAPLPRCQAPSSGSAGRELVPWLQTLHELLGLKLRPGDADIETGTTAVEGVDWGDVASRQEAVQKKLKQYVFPMGFGFQR